MSEGRTPTATLTQQRQLEQEDVDILNQIVIRAQNDPISAERPKDALLQAYGDVYRERRLSNRQDRACYNVLLKLLNPATPGESLYHKWENVLQDEGIVMTYEDDMTTQDASPRLPTRALDYEYEHGKHRPSRPGSGASQPMSKGISRPTEVPPEGSANDELDDDEYLDNPPTYIDRMMAYAVQRDRSVLFRQTLDALHGACENAREHRLEARADALYEIRLKQKTLKQCLAVFDEFHSAQIQADQLYLRTLARNALGKTRDEYHIHRIESIDDDRIKGLSLYKWTLASREASFVRRKDWRFKRIILRKLVECYRQNQARQAQLEAILQTSTARSQESVLRSAVLFFVQRTNTAQASEARAAMLDRGALYKASMNLWRARAGKLTELGMTAEDAREYFLMKRVIRQLQSVVRYRRDRRTWLAIWTLKKWREYMKAHKHIRYDESYRHVRKLVKMNLAHSMLVRWQQTMYKHRQQDQQADSWHESLVMQRTVKPVVEKMWDTADWAQRNEIVAAAKADHFLEQRAIAAIRMKQQALLDMHNRADRLRQYRTEQRAVQGLRQMQLKAFELQRRLYDAEAFRDRHDKRNVRNVLARLRRVFAERHAHDEGPLVLVPAPAITPAKKREELLLSSSARLSTTPAYTPFAARLRQEPRVLENIEDIEEELEDAPMDMVDGESES